MKPSEPMGLRLRDLHPECGGGVVVVGFERSAAGKKAGVLQGDRIIEVDGTFLWCCWLWNTCLVCSA